MLWRVTAGGWDLLGFEHLTRRSADYSPASADIPLVIEAMTALGRVASPDVELKDAGQRWGAYLDDPADARLFTGHVPHEAEQWAIKVPAWSTAPARALDLLATAQARCWQGTADDHPNAGTDRLSDAAAQWAAYRRGA